MNKYETLNNLYETQFPAIIEYVQKFADEQLQAIPKEVFKRYLTFKRFTKLIDETELMTGAIELTISTIPETITEQIWETVKNNTLQELINYITHVEYFPQSPFDKSFQSISSKYSIKTLIASRCVYDSIIHYIRKIWASNQ